MSNRDLIFDIFAIDRASAVFSRVGAEAEGMGGRVSKGGAVASAAMVTAGAAAVYLGAKSVSMAGDFQASMMRLTTTAGESPKALNLVSQGILDMAGKVGYTAQELATAMYQVESGGFHGANALSVLTAAAQGARIEGANVTDVAHALAGALNDYAGRGLNAVTATNAMTAAVGHGMMTFQDLSEALPKIGARAAAAHVTFQEMLAALSTMTKDGLPASVAATYLGQSIGQLAAPTAKARLEMEGLGINATKVAQQITSGTGHGLSDAINTLYDGIRNHLVGGGLVSVDTFKKMQNSTTDYQQVLAKLPPVVQTQVQALATMAGGVRSFQGVLMLGGAHAQQYATDLSAINEQVTKGGTKVAGFSDIQHTFNQQLADAKGAASALAIEFGQSLMPVATDVLHVLSGGIGILLNNKGALDSLVVGLEYAAGAYVAIKVAELAWMGIQGAVAVVETATAFASLAVEVSSASEAMTLMSMAWEATPIGAAAAVVGGVAAAVYGLTHAFGSSGPAIKVNEQEIDGLKLHYDRLTGSIQATGAAQIAQNLRSTDVGSAVVGATGRSPGHVVQFGNAIQAAHDLGIQESTLQLALMGNRHEMNFVTQSLDRMAKGTGVTAQEARGLLNALHLNQVAIAKSGQAQMTAANQATLLTSALAKIPGYYDMVNHATNLNTSMLAGLAVKYGWRAKEISDVMNNVMVPGGRQAVAAMITELDKLPEKMRTEAANALASGQQIGQNLAAGAQQGIGSGLGGVVTAATHMIDQAIAAAKAQAKIKSPSEVTRDEVGLQLGLGVASGLDKSRSAVEKAARANLEAAKLAMQRELGSADAALAKVNQQIKAADAWSSAFKDNVFGAQLTMPQSIGQVLIGGHAVSLTGQGALPANATAAQTFAAMMSYERQQLTKNTQLDHDVHRLRQLGLSQAALDEMQQGGNSGIQEINALAAMSKAQIQQFNALLARSQSALLDAGSYATSNTSVAVLQRRRTQRAETVSDIRKALQGLSIQIQNGTGTGTIRHH